MAGKVLNIKVCSPLKQHSGLTGKCHAICHYSYNLPLCEMHVLLLGYRPALKKNLNFVFLFIRKGYKVFSPLRYENDLFIRGKRIQYKYLTWILNYGKKRLYKLE